AWEGGRQRGVGCVGGERGGGNAECHRFSVTESHSAASRCERFGIPKRSHLLAAERRGLSQSRGDRGGGGGHLPTFIEMILPPRTSIWHFSACSEAHGPTLSPHSLT